MLYSNWTCVCGADQDVEDDDDGRFLLPPKDRFLLKRQEQYSSWVKHVVADLQCFKLHSYISDTNVPAGLSREQNTERESVDQAESTGAQQTVPRSLPLYESKAGHRDRAANREAVTVIFAHLGSQVTRKIPHENATIPQLSAYALWNWLEDSYGRIDIGDKFDIYAKNAKKATYGLDDYSDVEKWGSAFEKAQYKVNDLNLSPHELDAFSFLLATGYRYPGFVTNQLSRWRDGKNVPSCWDLRRALHRHIELERILARQASHSKSKRKRGNAERCDHCNKSGHGDLECWTKHPELRPSKRRKSSR